MSATTPLEHTCPACEQGQKQPSRQELVKQYEDAGSGYSIGKKHRALRLHDGPRPPITIRQILSWADEFHRITGRWPAIASRPKGLPTGESWKTVNKALYQGLRGLPGGSSLAILLAEQRDVHGPLTPERILAWADLHFEGTGEWPGTRSGRVRGAYRERWETIDTNLRQGRRGLPGGSSLRSCWPSRATFVISIRFRV